MASNLSSPSGLSARSQIYFAATIEEAKLLLRKAHINVLMQHFNGTECGHNENIFFDAAVDLLKNNHAIVGYRKKVLRHIVSRYAAARLSGAYPKKTEGPYSISSTSVAYTGTLVSISKDFSQSVLDFVSQATTQIKKIIRI